MTHYRFPRLERYRVGGLGDTLELAMPVPTSATGKVIRRCPSDVCAPRLFMLGSTPEHRAVSSEARCPPGRRPGSDPWTCPYCGRDDAVTAFMPAEDVEAVTGFVGALVAQDAADIIGEQLRRAFGTSSSNSGGFGISFKAARHAAPAPRLPVRHDLLRNLRCDSCGCSYGVFAIGLFCPDCGAANVMVHFEREVELVELQIRLAGELENEYGEEASYRILGNSHEDTLTALEAYQKAVFRYHERKRGTTPKDLKNAFQNVDRAIKLFKTVHLEPYGVLCTEELNVLRRHIQKRHVIGHNLGQVDEKFEDVTCGMREGELVPILAAEVLEFAHLCGRIIADLDASLRR